MAELPPIQFHSSVGSTNDLALAANNVKAPHGSCWAADHQTSGRGRREVGGDRREWFSPEHANLYLSVLLRPDVEPAKASGLTLAAAAGVCHELRALSGVDIWIKWPNDLYIGSKKVGGILTEALTERNELQGVVVGLGINVNISEEQVPEELADIMTSLQIGADGKTFDRLRLLPAIRDAVVEYSERYAADGFPGIIEQLRAYDRTKGKTVSILQGGDWVDGTSLGVSDAGGLVVEIDGEEHEVQAGEVRFGDF